MKISGYLSFEFCYSEPHGNEVIGFDVYLNWRTPEIVFSEVDIERGGSLHTDLMVKAESLFVTKEYDFVPLFRVRDAGQKLRLIHRRRRLVLPLRSSGAGGNWHWEVYRTAADRWAHALNYLRSFKPSLSLSEWDENFRERVWDKRGSIQRGDIAAVLRMNAKQAVVARKANT